jgi:WD40 repeat protein
MTLPFKSFLVALFGMMTLSLALAQHELAAQSLTLVAWSPDGAKLATVQNEPTPIISIYDTSTFTLIYSYTQHLGSIYSLKWSPTSALIASGDNSNQIRIWDTNGDTQQILSHSVGTDTLLAFEALAWGIDEQTLASGNNIGFVAIWNVATGELKTSFYLGSLIQVTYVEWSSDYTTLLASSSLGEVRIWKVDDQVLLSQFTIRDYTPAIDWVPEKELVIIGKNQLQEGVYVGLLQLWNVTLGTSVKVLTQHDGRMSDVIWDEQTHQIISADQNGNILVWDSETGEILDRFSTSLQIQDIEYSPFKGRLALVGVTLEGSTSLTNTLQLFVPTPSLDRLNTVAESCLAPEARVALVSDQTRLPEFVTAIEALSDDQIPSGCKADLLAVAQAIQATE